MGKWGERRVRRLAQGTSTKRSQLKADEVTQVLREQGAAQLANEAELTLVLDGMELRRAEAEAQEYLMRVKALNGGMVNGYRSVNVLGLGSQGGRGLLYHRLFSSQAPGFVSETNEIFQAIEKTEASLRDFPGPITWVMDAGYDNDDVWWKVWERAERHLVCRLFHYERIILWQTPAGVWEERYLDAVFKHLVKYAQVETELEVRLHGQKRPKRQKVQVEIAATPIRVYRPDHQGTKDTWLVRVTVLDSPNDPWYLLTDWPVVDEGSALRVFIFYRKRWSVEDTFKFIKTCFGAEEVQLLDFQAVRTLVAFAWVAAGFLFHLGLTLEHEEVRLLARLGGWEQRAHRPPGKQILTLGLRRMLDHFTTDALLRQYKREQGDFPPFVRQLMDTFGISPDNY